MLKLFGQLLPVLAFIPLGWLIKTKTSLATGWVDKVLINILLPLMIFYHVQRADDEKLIVYPIITFSLSLLMMIPAFIARKTFAGKANPYLLNTAFSFFNIAFFGLPVVKALFDEQLVSSLICIYLGSALYGNTIGYYQVGRTKDGAKKAFMQMLKIPFLYVFIVSIIVKIIGLHIPESVEKGMGPVGWLVSALGMMVVGFNLKGVKKPDWDFWYLTRLNGLRTLAALFFMTALLFITGLFYSINTRDLQLLILIPFFPVASNVSVFASYLDTEKEQSSILVLFAIIFSLIFVPIVIQFFN